MSAGDNAVPFVVIGAGPYGLAVASHLRGAGREVRIFGKVMDFWESQMPRGMMLRSPHDGSDIADPDGQLTLGRYEAAHGIIAGKQVSLADFVGYGKWFQGQALPDLDDRHVTNLERVDGGFRLELDDGERLVAERVVIATGIGSFAHIPPPFASLPRERVSHASDRANRDLGRFRGQRVLVVGGGQSATESAALLHESGADVELLVRQPRHRWLKSGTFIERAYDTLSPLKAPGKIGPIGLNWLIEHPHLYTLMPRRMQDRLAARAIRPAASSWLKPRAEGVPIRTDRQVVSATVHGDKVRVRLNDGTDEDADHILLGTGYKIALSRYRFLSLELLQGIRTANGYPLLNGGFESSVPGLYFVGAPAAFSFGPLCRFVVGTRFTARTLTRKLRRERTQRVLVTAQS